MKNYLKRIYISIVKILSLILTKFMIDKYLKNNEIKKLHIGAGNRKIKDWLNTDIGNKSIMPVVDVTKKFPFNTKTFDYVFSEHMIEHIKYQDGVKMLKESFRVLKSNGKIRISTPDLQFLIDLYLNEKDQLQKDYIEWSCKNYQLTEGSIVEVVNNYFQSWGHQFIYDKNTIENTLKAVGFTKIEFFKINESNNLELKDLENDKRLPKNFLQLESLSVEATKH
ncbi:methyltransferase domain-containing protein [Pelagibacteraceae bacterium]|jgi:predicted SAM-dependent methyltransferase|nr:methyltransferase domain-containing protein [Pelagibacteraceae bacterium]